MSGSDDARAPERLDLFLAGSLFFDIVFTDLRGVPRPGTEVMANGMGSLPGGVANLAVAAARLGLVTGLAAGFGDDAYGHWNWAMLGDQEGIDLARSRIVEGWHSSVTVSLNQAGDRSMITHADPMPLGVADLIGAELPDSRAFFVDLGEAGHRAADAGSGAAPWWRPALSGDTLVFADLGWDDSGTWDEGTLALLDGCHAFLPNHVEAMAYTRTDTPEAAVRRLADRVPLAVVTMGGAGAIAIDQSTGEEARVPSLPVPVLDATGAGDVFAAAMIAGTLREWPLVDRLNFATLCSGLAVQHFGGSLGSPGWGELADWRAAALARAEHDEAAHEIAARFDFIDRALQRGAPAARRARATLEYDRRR
ncbi:carbohydrate kinase family protein [Leucobacter zeae]|nr:carbohydrate kinase family protein [Leucobacter zeae]